MRLLNTETLSCEVFFGSNIPSYAILSHTWGEDECTLQDVLYNAGKTKSGYQKLTNSAKQAKGDGLKYLWMDTCCIDKTSSSELSEAINSMFRWYRDASACYVYLTDLDLSGIDPLNEEWVSINKSAGYSDTRWKRAFRASRWFTRGWTLQELIAPRNVIFFSRKWHLIGTKHSLLEDIQEITGIDRQALNGTRPLSEYTVEERFSWAERRNTTRVEDRAYCLLGIFDVYMPLLYGEGHRAFQRLAEEVAKNEEGYKLINRRKQLGHTRTNLWTYLARETVHQGGTTDDTKDGMGITKESTRRELRVSELVFRQRKLEERDDNKDDDQREFTERPSSPHLVPSISRSQLRILTLYAGVIGDRLQGHVEEFNFSNAPPYYALSYTWGDEPDLHPIFINKTMRLIRSNLFHALQRVRLRSGSLNIWIDSICINQEDETERNAQVRQMADIYRNATGVMVWLGEKDFTSDMAIELIAKINEPKYSWEASWWDDYGFVALSQILERPWFRRRWVLQEAALSSNTTLYCGDQQVYRSTFSDAVNLVRAKLSKATPLDVQMNQNSPFAFLANFRDSSAVRLLDLIEIILRRSKLPLEVLVDLVRFSDTTDHRDTIYALLSLARDAPSTSAPLKTSAMIVPDYSKTVLDVYSDFILHCIHSSDSLDIVCRPWAPINSNRQLVHGIKTVKIDSIPLPSWIATRDRLPFGDPSLRLTHRVNGKPLVDSGTKRVYNCHLYLKPKVRLGRDSESKKYNGSLYVKGFIIGKVIETSMRMPNALITKECLNLLVPLHCNNVSSRPFSVPDVVWRTLCADRDEKGDPAPTFYRSAMSHLLQLSCKIQEGNDASIQQHFLDNVSYINIEELLSADLNDHVRTFLEIVRDVVWNRRTFQAVAEAKIDKFCDYFVGLVPQSAKMGDRVCILYGCSVPVVLRQIIQPNQRITWRLIGDAYVDGIMDGELIEVLKMSSLQTVEVEFEIQ